MNSMPIISNKLKSKDDPIMTLQWMNMAKAVRGAHKMKYITLIFLMANVTDDCFRDSRNELE